MSKLINVAVDAMGGDNAPHEVVKGTVEAVNDDKELAVYLVGKEDMVYEELKKYEYDKDRIKVVNATEIIGFDEPPVAAIKNKKDSSIVVALNLVKNKEADAFVSAGSTGAILVGGLGIVGRIKGVARTPLATLIPTLKGFSLLIDCGANVDARAAHLVQFAKMGSLYMENLCGVKNPRVGIVNIGVEEEKGNALVKETYPLLRDCEGINFDGSCEARDIPYGEFDVIVCEGFVGNVILKLYEGLASALLKKVKEGMMSSTISKLGAAMSKKAIKNSL
jgi:glycerol-3-phosphate acyltransferase PlsX